MYTWKEVTCYERVFSHYLVVQYCGSLWCISGRVSTPIFDYYVRTYLVWRWIQGLLDLKPTWFSKSWKTNSSEVIKVWKDKKKKKKKKIKNTKS